MHLGKLWKILSRIILWLSDIYHCATDTYNITTKTLWKHYGCTTGLQATGHYRSLQLLHYRLHGKAPWFADVGIECSLVVLWCHFKSASWANCLLHLSILHGQIPEIVGFCFIEIFILSIIPVRGHRISPPCTFRLINVGTGTPTQSGPFQYLTDPPLRSDLPDLPYLYSISHTTFPLSDHIISIISVFRFIIPQPSRDPHPFLFGSPASATAVALTVPFCSSV